MNQQAKGGICQSIGKVHDDTRKKMKGKSEVKLHETTLDVTTKCCYTCGEEKDIYLVTVLESKKDFPHMWWNMKTRN